MSLIRQIGLIPAGCQPWNLNVVDASGTRFAYAATLAIYIYEWNPESNQFYLHSIMSEHKKTISAIAWHLKDKDILASSSTDFKICIWHITKHKLLATLNTPHSVPSLMAFFPAEDDCVAYCDGKGPLYLWKYSQNERECISQPLKEIAAVSSNITQLSWHATATGRFVLGHADGTVSFYIQGKKPQKHVKLPGIDTEDTNRGNSITALQWDPFSSNYVLVCTSNGKLQLVDASIDVASVITTYRLPSKAVTIKCVAWLTEAPGSFITGDGETGVLRIWAVPKEKPQESFRLKQVGFKALCVLPSDNKATNLNGKIKFTSRIVCLFFDGGVGVYNLKNSSWDFLRDMGHLETIFDCQFKPDNCDLLATASFDGTVKVWNVDTMEAINSSHGDASIIYSLSWAPGCVNCLVAATSKSGIFIWNVEKGGIKKIEDHEKGSYVYCVTWNQKDARKIASAGGDGTCMVHQMDGKLLQTFKHPAPVYGCDWNPNNENIVATACEDSLIRVFYVGGGTDQPIKVLSGHEGKVFRVKWSPLNDGILCSTSDDCSVRIWHYARGIAVRILEGHTSYSRGLLWCPELPNIVISGSWDSTIRVWDINDGACLDVIEDHGADVYGLACHSERPFMLASTSRDSTVRLWSVFPLVSHIYLKILVSRPLGEIFSPSAIQSTEDFDLTLGLYGLHSKNMKDIISKSENYRSPEIWRAVSAFFCPSSGTANLFDLIDVLKDKEVDFSQYKTGIVHRKHVIKLTTAKALEKELANVSFFGSGVNCCGKEENILRAAEYHLLTGNLKKYCELKIQLGEWLEALALAPGVSLSYWKELSSRWLNLIKEENSKLIAPLCIATNNSDELIKHYVKQNLMEKAHIVSVAVSEGLLPSVSILSDKVEEKDVPGNTYNELIKENLKHLSERYLLCGYPARAACWQLSNGEIQEAIYCLLRGHELELAINISLSLDVEGSLFQMATVYLSRRCAQKGNWELALEVLSLIPGNENEKIKICIMCCLSEPERDDLHQKAGLPCVKDCADIAQDELNKNVSIMKAVQYYLLSSDPKKGLDIGLKYVKDILNEPRWRLEPLWQILYCMSFIKSSVLQDISCDRHRFELQVYSAYIGALIAIRQGFYPVVVPLFSTALNLMRRVHNATLSITEDLVSSEMHAWVNAKNSIKKNQSEDNIYKEMMSKALEDVPFADIGVTIVSGSNLPRHSDHHRCYLRGSTIQGPVYFLDDSKSSISLNDALMWAKVNRFSPLKTGNVIEPF